MFRIIWKLPISRVKFVIKNRTISDELKFKWNNSMDTMDSIEVQV